MRELSGEDLKFLSLFERVTGIFPADFFQRDSILAFVVDKEEVAQAIGKNGMHIRRLQDMLRKKVVVVGNDPDPEQLVRNFFSNLRLLDVQHILPEKMLYVYVDEQDRGFAIGKNGERIKIAKDIFRAKFGLDVEIRTRRML